MAHGVTHLFCGCAKMGQQRDALKLAQRLRHDGFVLIDVKARARNGARFKGCDQGGFVNNFTARDIDEMRGWLHGVKDAFVDQVGRFCAARCGDDEKVDFGGEGVKTRDLRGGELNFFGRAIEKLDAHAKAEVTAPCDGLSDPAHADNADGFACDVAAKHLGRGPARPIARSGEALAFACAAGGHQEKRQADIGGGVCDRARCVCYGNAVITGSGDIDVVDANSEVGQNFAFGAAKFCKNIS